MNISTVETLLRLVRISLDFEPDLSIASDINWGDLKKLSSEHGLAALVSDGLQKVYDADPNQLSTLNSPENKITKYDLYSSILSYEANYELHKNAIRDLVYFLNQRGIKTLLMKGLGVARYYPQPSHRSTGDIDIYLYGRGREADWLIRKECDIRIKSNEDKHSVFKYQGISVENHAKFVNVSEHPSLGVLEDFLEKQAINASGMLIKDIEVLCPSIMMDALFLPYHLACHFVYGGFSLKHLVDWAVFVARHGNEINWDTVFSLSKSAGYYQFLQILNGIIIDHLGVDAESVPLWIRDREKEKLVWEDMISPKTTTTKRSLYHKIQHYFSSKWKYELVYRDKFYTTFFRRGWASFRGQYLPKSKSVWDV